MSHHTKECNIGERRLRKKFAWFSICGGYIVFFEQIIVEEEYREKPTWESVKDIVVDYHWKIVKKWTLKQFEDKHGSFDENKAKEHKRKCSHSLH